MIMSWGFGSAARIMQAVHRCCANAELGVASKFKCAKRSAPLVRGSVLAPCMQWYCSRQVRLCLVPVLLQITMSTLRRWPVISISHLLCCSLLRVTNHHNVRHSDCVFSEPVTANIVTCQRTPKQIVLQAQCRSARAAFHAISGCNHTQEQHRRQQHSHNSVDETHIPHRSCTVGRLRRWRPLHRILNNPCIWHLPCLPGNRCKHRRRGLNGCHCRCAGGHAELLRVKPVVIPLAAAPDEAAAASCKQHGSHAWNMSQQVPHMRCMHALLGFA